MTQPDIPPRYTVLEVLSRSEIEVVLRARDEVLGREVWIKRPGAQQARAFRDRDLRAQALGEARALARVQHPAIVRLIDVLESAAGPVLVLEPSPGETLAERLAREGRLAPPEVARLGAALAGALEALHAAGIVHRGLAGRNIVLGSDGAPRLASASFAKDLAANTLSGTSLSFTFLGSEPAEDHASQPAPEQILGKAADGRSDLFGLGWLLHRALTGELPFTERDPTRWKAPRDPAELVPAVPRDLARALARALAVSPAKRFASAGEMRAAFERVAASFAEPSGAPPAPARRARASRRTWALAGGGAVLAIGALTWIARRPREAAPSERGIAAQAPATEGALAEEYARSWAITIGIGAAYDARGFAALPNAERDAAALADLLDAQPKDDWRTAWDVTRLFEGDASGDAILATVRGVAARAGPDDRLFLYYAGHGEGHETSSDTGWIVPADARPLADDPQRVSWLRFDEFQRVFDETRAKHVLVAMDCCYGGRLVVERSSVASPFTRALLAQKAHVVISSGRPNDRVSDGAAGGHSPFAQVFLEELARPAEITSSMLLGALHAHYRAAGETRLPQLGYPEGHPLGGEFVFFGE